MSQRDPLLTVRQLAEREGLPEWKVRKLISGRVSGARLPAYDVGGIRVRQSEYQAWLASRARR